MSEFSPGERIAAPTAGEINRTAEELIDSERLSRNVSNEALERHGGRGESWKENDNVTLT
jgi:hypothetical protein